MVLDCLGVRMRKHPQCTCKDGRINFAILPPHQIEHNPITKFLRLKQIDSFRAALMDTWMGIYRDKFKFQIFKSVVLFACGCLVAKECVEIRIPVRDYVPFQKF